MKLKNRFRLRIRTAALAGFAIICLQGSPEANANGRPRSREAEARRRERIEAWERFKHHFPGFKKLPELRPPRNGSDEQDCKPRTVRYSVSVPDVPGMKIDFAPDSAEARLGEKAAERWLSKTADVDLEKVFENSFVRTKTVVETLCKRTRTTIRYDVSLVETRRRWLPEQDIWCRMRGLFGACQPTTAAEIADGGEVIVDQKEIVRETVVLPDRSANDCVGERGDELKSHIAEICKQARDQRCLAHFGELQAYRYWYNEVIDPKTNWITQSREDLSLPEPGYRASAIETRTHFDYDVETRSTRIEELAAERLRFGVDSIQIGSLNFERRENGIYSDFWDAERVSELEAPRPSQPIEIVLTYRNHERGEAAGIGTLKRTETLSLRMPFRKLQFSLKDGCD